MYATPTIKNLTTDNWFCKKDLRIPRLRYFCHDGVVSVLFHSNPAIHLASCQSGRRCGYHKCLFCCLDVSQTPQTTWLTLNSSSPNLSSVQPGFFISTQFPPLSSSTYQVSLMSPPNISLDHLLSIFSNPTYSKLPSTFQPDLQLLHLPPSNPCFTTSFSAFLKV